MSAKQVISFFLLTFGYLLGTALLQIFQKAPMSPEQLSFMIGSIYGSTLTLLLLRPNRRSRNRRDPFLDCRDRCSAKGPTTPKPSFAELLLPPPRDQDPN